LFFASKLRQCGKPFRDVIRKIAFEHGHQTLSHPRPHAAHIEVRRVFPPGLPDFAQVLAQSLATFAKQRSDDGTCLGMNACKSCETGPAEQVRKHRFRLIVLRVRHGDPAGFPVRSKPLKKVVPHPTSCVF
jgi:hypothetical protein